MSHAFHFGDWIEHRLILEEIVAPETEATYPRIVAQNKPRYRYCQVCKGKQRRTVATWVCLQCSNTQEQGVVVCAACLAEAHEDHYAEEIVY
jgi:snRNA-activating protein complex (SNAPc), subunit 3